MKVFVDAIGLAAPGLNGWQESLPVLRGSRLMKPMNWSATSRNNCRPMSDAALLIWCVWRSACVKTYCGKDR